jgi:hypothetical protein
MSLDKDDKARKKFNAKFRKITKAEVDALTSKQREVYKEIIKNENIAAVPKEGFNPLLAGKPTFRLKEFDSETYAKIKRPLMSPSREKRDETMAKRRAKANQYRTDLKHPGASKGYGFPTRESDGEQVSGGMKVPKRNPARRPAPKEKIDYRVGGMVKSIVDNRKKK